MGTVGVLLEKLGVAGLLPEGDADKAVGVQVTQEEGESLTIDVRLPRDEGGFRVVRIVRQEEGIGTTSVRYDIKEVGDRSREVEDAARQGFSGT